MIITLPQCRIGLVRMSLICLTKPLLLKDVKNIVNNYLIVCPIEIDAISL